MYQAGIIGVITSLTNYHSSNGKPIKEAVLFEGKPQINCQCLNHYTIAQVHNNIHQSINRGQQQSKQYIHDVYKLALPPWQKRWW